MRQAWKKFFLKYFDLNNDGIINWWEVVIPLLLLLIVQIAIEVIANIITQYIHI